MKTWHVGVASLPTPTCHVFIRLYPAFPYSWRKAIFFLGGRGASVFSFRNASVHTSGWFHGVRCVDGHHAVHMEWGNAELMQREGAQQHCHRFSPAVVYTPELVVWCEGAQPYRLTPGVGVGREGAERGGATTL
jgi:hypothetical protein